MGEEAPAKYIAEFVGTFLLIFTVGCNVITGQAVWGGISIACVLTVSIYALGKSSGGNFNPAVSVALGMTGQMKWSEVGMYCVTQILAGIVAAFAYVGLFGMQHSFNLSPVGGHTWWQACLVETIYTFMLCFVVLNVAVKDAGNQYYGLAIGFVVVAGAYGAGNVSMGCFNPAVAFSLDVASFWIGFKFGPIYMIFEILGGVLAAVLFKACRPEYASVIEEGDDAGKPTQESIDAVAWENAQTVDGPYKKGDYPESCKLLSEFLGTFMLVLTVGLNVLGGSKAGAFSIACALMSMIFALGSCSGAHFNPAVTMAIMVRGKHSIASGINYMGVQIVAGVCAAFTYAAIMNGETFKLNPGTYKWNQVVVAEFVFTFLLCFVVLCVATCEKPHLSQYFGFAIGMCVTAGGFAIGKISGGSLNPAVSIGISSSHLIGGGGGWPCIVYTIVEIVAGVFAAIIFQLTQPSECKEGDAEKGETQPLKATSSKKN